MASEHHISIIKQQASRLQQGLAFYRISMKRTQALEFISRYLYGYSAWNVVTGHSENKVIDTTLYALQRQIADLCRVVPSLSYKLADLQFDGETPSFVYSSYFHKSAVAIASIFMPGNPHAFMYEELVIDRYASKEALFALPPALQPKNAHELYMCLKGFIEYQNISPEHAPWNKWHQRMIKAGVANVDVIQQARAAYRESFQHGWDDDLKLFCGYFDDGKQLAQLVERYPDEMSKVITYLMDSDGNTFTP